MERWSAMLWPVTLTQGPTIQETTGVLEVQPGEEVDQQHHGGNALISF